jgi:hypothetical protein
MAMIATPALRRPAGPRARLLAGQASLVAHLPDALPWALGSIALAAIVFFDFGPNLAFNDDWSYGWLAAHTNITGVPDFPYRSASAYVQVVWAHLATFGHPQPYLLRLSILPFVVLAAFSSWRLARSLGADRFWAGFAAIGLLTMPVYLTLATSFMSEVPYIALLLAAASAGVAWLQEGKGQWACVIWATLATLQRQIGISIPVALTLALLLGRGARKPERRDLAYLGLLWVALAAITLPQWLSPGSPATQFLVINRVMHPDPNQLWRSTGYLPITLGFFLIPFLVGLLFQHRAQLEGRSPWAAAPGLLIGAAGLVALLSHFRKSQSLFPGNVWTDVGFTPALWGIKPPIFPLPVHVAIAILSTLTLVVFFIVRWNLWTRHAPDTASIFLVLLAGIQAALTLPLFVYDRYYLVPAAVLVPVVAAAASRSTQPRLAAIWVTAAAALGIGLYAVAQQDYEAWQQARERAAQTAYHRRPAAEVNAGYEANAVHVVIPGYERGEMNFNQATTVLLTNSPQTKLWLWFAQPNSPLPGVRYSSLAPGKIVVTVDPPETR